MASTVNQRVFIAIPNFEHHRSAFALKALGGMNIGSPVGLPHD
jgi:hypothetical protein